MSGTSLDGVDAAWLETDGVAVRGFGPAVTVPYPDGLRRRLRALLDLAPTLPAGDPRIAAAEADLTDHHVQAVKALNVEADLVGFHGQTILHRPQDRRTWQIGNGQALADALGLPVAFDFRSADVAAGGQGAPLVPVFHAALAAHLPKPLAILNIGGVANVTWIGRDGYLLAFDTGPGNGPLDDWTERHSGERFDRDGMLAGAGKANAAVLGRLLDDPYFSQPAPKSLDRLDFATRLGGSGLQDLGAADGAATLVAFTVGAVAKARFPEPPLRWLVCGGGRHNPVIMQGLRQACGVPVEPVEAVGWDGDALEAQCFGFLAARTEKGLALSYPGTTGVPHPMGGGRIVRPMSHTR